MTDIKVNGSTRVCLVVRSLRVAGAETMVENLAYALIDKGISVRVVALQDDRSIITKRMDCRGVDYILLGKRPGIDFSVIPRLAGVMSEFSADVVHSNQSILSYVVPAACRAHVVSRVHTVHSVAQKEPQTRWEAWFNGFCYRHGIVRPVALSELNKSTIENFYRVPATKIEVVPNGINLSAYHPKTSYGIEGTPRVCQIARFEEAKNHRAVIGAIKILADRGVTAYFDFYGVGPLMDDMKAQAKGLGLSDRVFFHGLTDDVPRVLSESDVFILPSLWEGMPMTVVEAMAAGMPIVAGNVGGIPDILEDGISALLCEPSAEDIANSLERILKDSKLRERLGRNALIDSVKFGSDLMAERYLDIYEKGKNGR